MKTEIRDHSYVPFEETIGITLTDLDNWLSSNTSWLCEVQWNLKMKMRRAVLYPNRVYIKFKLHMAKSRDTTLFLLTSQVRTARSGCNLWYYMLLVWWFLLLKGHMCWCEFKVKLRESITETHLYQKKVIIWWWISGS